MEAVEIGDATLYRGDALEILPGIEPIDVILTDPVWQNCPPGLIPGSDDPYGLWACTMTLLPPLRRLITVLRCDCDPRFLGPVPEHRPSSGPSSFLWSCRSISAAS